MNQAPLVLLHGWGLGPSIWSALREALPAGRPVVTPTLPGHSGEGSTINAHLDAWSDAIAADLPPGGVLCGWSLGGILAANIALRHPDRAACLVLVGTTPRFVAIAGEAASSWQHGLDAATVAGFIDGFRREPATIQRRFVALQALGDTNRRAVTTALNQSLADAERHAEALAGGLDLLAHVDLRETMPRLRLPVHIFHGAHDALMPLGAAHWLVDHIPGARLTVFPDCGHAPFLSRPTEFVDALVGLHA